MSRDPGVDDNAGVATIPVLWVTGPPGVGKTAVAWEIYERLQRAGEDPAYVDVDQLGMCAPPPDADPDLHMLKALNVAGIRNNFGAYGARMLIVSGVVDARRGPDVDAAGGPRVGVARLRTDPDELRSRLRRRNAGVRPQRGSPERHEGAVAVAEVFDRSSFADWSIDTTGLSIEEVASSVLERIGDWLGVESERADVAAPHTAEATPTGGEVLWLSGPTGVGKSTVGFRAYLDILRWGARAAFIDVDQLGFDRNASSELSLQARNLAAVWGNVHNVGARLGVVVGCVPTRAEARRYEQALPQTTITWCQLRVDDAELTRRIVSRGEGGSWVQPGDPLLARPEDELLAVARGAIATASLIDQGPFGLRVDVDGLNVENAAAKVLRATAWPTGSTR